MVSPSLSSGCWSRSEQDWAAERVAGAIRDLRRSGLTCCLATSQEKYRAAYMWELMGFGELVYPDVVEELRIEVAKGLSLDHLHATVEEVNDYIWPVDVSRRNSSWPSASFTNSTIRTSPCQFWPTTTLSSISSICSSRR